MTKFPSVTQSYERFEVGPLGSGIGEYWGDEPGWVTTGEGAQLTGGGERFACERGGLGAGNKLLLERQDL